MEEAWLRSQLASGRSIESIAHEAGRHPSTVAYWVNKHGLDVDHTARHAAAGRPGARAARGLLAEGLTVRAMAARLAVSYSTVRHWLGRYGLATPRGRRLAETAPARASGAETVEATCPVHGLHAVRAPRRRRVPLPPVPERRRGPPPQGDQAPARGGGGRRVPHLRIRPLRWRGCTSITSIRRARRSRWRTKGVTRSLEAGSRRGAKCVLVCARTAMPKSKLGSPAPP